MDIQITVESTDPFELDDAINLLTDLRAAIDVRLFDTPAREVGKAPELGVSYGVDRAAGPDAAAVVVREGNKIVAAELTAPETTAVTAPLTVDPKGVDIAALATQLIGKKGIPFVADLVKQVNGGVKVRVSELEGKARDNFIIAAQDALAGAK